MRIPIIQLLSFALLTQFMLPSQAQDVGADLEFGFEAGASPYLKYQKSRRLWIDVIQVDRGLKVTGVYPNSPVLRMASPADQNLIAAMEVGDIIEAIDGLQTRTLDDRAQGIAIAGQSCELTVFDKNKSQSVQWIVFPMLAQIPQMRTVAAQAPAPAKLYVVIVGSTKDQTLGPSVVRSLGELKGYLEGEVSASRFVVKEVIGDDCNPSGIVQAIDGLPIGFGDSLLVYYLGHGAYDRA